MALGRDSERDDVRAVSDLKPVEHHHREAHVIQPAAHQLPQRGPCSLDEPLRDRALTRRCAGPLDLLADRLTNLGVLTRRDAGEHPIHHHPGERITIGEVPIRLDRQLVLIIGRADPGAAYRYLPPTQGHRPVFVTMTLRSPVGLPLPLRSDRPRRPRPPSTHARRRQTVRQNLKLLRGASNATRGTHLSVLADRNLAEIQMDIQPYETHQLSLHSQ